jgi:hypothetical protein
MEIGKDEMETIWGTLYNLFQDNPKENYLAEIFLWLAKKIMQTYIRWAFYDELGDKEKKSIQTNT